MVNQPSQLWRQVTGLNQTLETCSLPPKDERKNREREEREKMPDMDMGVSHRG